VAGDSLLAMTSVTRSVVVHPALRALSLTVLLAASPAPAQETYEPQIGQPGKDVVWVPTPERLVERMLAMAQVGPGDVVFDLGSGDGRMVIAAAKRGAQAVGVEYNPDLVALARRNAEGQGLPTAAARFVPADIFETDFSSATVVTLYLLPDLNARLRPKLLDMRPGTRVASHMFRMEDWEPDETSYLVSTPAYLWIVPARVQGTWAFALDGVGTFSIDLEQTFQKLSGTVELGPVRAGLRDARVHGDAVSFAFVDGKGVLHELEGKATGNGLEGTFRAGARNGPWTARRAEPKPLAGLQVSSVRSR
jgi:Methyltransferase domain